MERLLSKLADFVSECEELYGMKLVYENKVKIKHVKKLYALKQEENIEFGHECGKRNSYSKTDKDVTFMRMKEDAMKNDQLKQGYNVQH